MTRDDKTRPRNRYLTTREAAEFLALRPNTLEKMRVYGGGPRYRKHGRRVRYLIDDLIAWSDRRRRDMTHGK